MDDMPVELSSSEVLGKRKRNMEPIHEISDDDDDIIVKKEAKDADGNFVPDEADDADADGDDIDAMLDGELSDAEDEDFYTEMKEDLPELPAYDDQIPRIKSSLTNIVKGILDSASQNARNSIHVARFQETGSSLLQIPKPPVIKIALLGEAGTGKSSLLNSLIDHPDLARALSGGESCTSVPCEFSSAFKGQDKQFAAEATYFDMSSVKALLKEHLEAYHIFTFNEDEEWDPDLRLQYKRRSDTAMKTFLSIFRKNKHFADEETAATYLKANRKYTVKLVELMHGWCKEMYQGILGDSGLVKRCAADEQNDFRKLIDPLVNPSVNTDEPALWPLVKFLRIGVRGSRILENITLADLPGISDTNQVKVDATLEYLRECHGLWVVARMDRVVSDTTVDSLLARFGERFADNIAVIATRSDDNVNQALAAYLAETNVPLGDYYKLTGRSQQLQKHVSLARRQLSSRLQALDTTMRAAKVSKIKAVLEKALDEKAEVDNTRSCLLVEARNRLNVRRVQREMQAHMPPGKKLPVFCVSNQHYLALKNAVEPESFQLSADQTGIPALRHHALTLAAHGLQQSLEDYMTHHLHVFLRGVWLWVTSQYVQGASDLKVIVHAPLDDLQKEIALYLGEFKEGVDEHLTHHLLVQTSRFAQKALTLFEGKRRDRHWATILAFMRKDGNYQTSACPKESWNEGFLDPATRIIRQRWDEVKGSQDGLIADRGRGLIQGVGKIMSKIRQRRSGAKLELDDFQEMIGGSIQGIKNAVRDHQERFSLELRNIKLDATQDRNTGFFTKAMRSAYERCKDDSGKGCVARSISYITGALSQEDTQSPFDAAANAIATAINDNAETQAKTLQTELQTILQDIFDYFDGMVNEGKLNPEEKIIRAQLKPLLEKFMAEFEQLQKDLEMIKAKYAALEAKKAKQARKAQEEKSRGDKDAEKSAAAARETAHVADDLDDPEIKVEKD